MNSGALTASSRVQQYLQLRESVRWELARRDRVEFARQLGIEPDPWQTDLLHSTSKRILLNCSRQSGKSTTTAIRTLHTAIYEPGSLVLVLGPAERQAKEFFAKVLDFYGRLGLTNHRVGADSERKLGMQLENGSRIEALPGSEKTIRGFSGVDLLVLDEAARVDDALYHAVRPMLAVSGGVLMMLTSPFGKRGVFYEEWTNETRTERTWERFRVTAEECPRITKDFLKEERASLPGWVYRQEYECSFEETEDQVFTTEMVERAVSSEVTPLFAQS